MNSFVPPEREALTLVDIIQFKWLMSREGHHVHVERLQNDPAYARQCLAQGSHIVAVAREQGKIRPGAMP